MYQIPRREGREESKKGKEGVQWKYISPLDLTIPTLL